MYTTQETVHLLCKSILTRLENRKAISFSVEKRQTIQNELYALIGPFIYTEEDLRNQTLDKLGANASILEDSNFSESDQYKSAKSVVRSSFGDDVLNGFYYQKPIRVLAQLIRNYLMESSLIEEVFESDADLDKMIVETIQKFNPELLH